MLSLRKKSNDSAGVQNPAKQGRKRGRPPIQSTSDSTSPGDIDEDFVRNQRTALKSNTD
jgi:hypothetical protein